ncbi:MAG: DUF1269 domain-containing protein [Gemmatimonadaceae bacterium]
MTLVTDGRAEVDDAVLVTWPPGRRKPSTRPLGGLTRPGRLWGGFWGLVLGLIFLTPLAGPTFGAAAGALAGSLSDFGVEDHFGRDVRVAITPGTSAVFAVSAAGSAERLAGALEALDVRTLSARLSPAQEQRLRDALGEESVPASGVNDTEEAGNHGRHSSHPR